jgi:hypothetical protein
MFHGHAAGRRQAGDAMAQAYVRQTESVTTTPAPWRPVTTGSRVNAAPTDHTRQRARVLASLVALPERGWSPSE